MGGELSTLPAEVPALQHLVLRLQEELSIATSRATVLEQELKLLRTKLFGRRSERLVGEPFQQSSLFNEAECAAASSPEPPAPEASVEVASHRRAKSGRRPLPDDLPREEVLHDIPEDEKICACCGAPLVRIGQETDEQVDFEPARLKVIRHVRPKYACQRCEGAGSEHPVKIAPVPPQIIEKSIVTPGLLAFILVSKFCDAIPFYRQEKQFARIGVQLPRGDFCHWAAQAALKCDPLMEIFLEQIRSGPVVQMDETRVQVMKEPGRADTTQSFMWVMRGGPPQAPLILYRYHPSRSASIPLQYLSGYHGFLQTDGYEGYAEVGSLPGIIHSGCWSHARRKYDEAAKASKHAGSAHEAMGRIAKLYRIERELRAQPLSPEAFLAQRKAQVLLILQEFKQWLDSRVGQVPPSLLLGKAMQYTLSEWPKLLRYLDSPYLTPDTNLIENAIRPFVIGRRNWLFSGSPRGAHASATLYSLIETARANGIEPYRYLRYLFTKLPLARSREDYLALTPHHLDQAEFQKLSL